MSVPITLRSTDGRNVRVEFAPFSLSPDEAMEFASALMGEAQYARRLPDFHEKHVNLLASCALCRGEAGAQTDRLAYEATCAACGDQCIVPGDEDPEDTLCVACAEDEQTS